MGFKKGAKPGPGRPKGLKDRLPRAPRCVERAVVIAATENGDTSELTIDWVLTKLKSVVDTGEPKAMVQALGLIGKYRGMFIERHEHSGGLSFKHEISETLLDKLSEIYKDR